MRDPELVARAGYAAARLEQAWERWRALHGLSGSADPLASYVGYSHKDPMGQPRVVIGVDAAEAEFFADFLEGHDCAVPGLGSEAGVAPGATRPAAEVGPMNGSVNGPMNGPMNGSVNGSGHLPVNGAPRPSDSGAMYPPVSGPQPVMTNGQPAMANRQPVRANAQAVFAGGPPTMANGSAAMASGSSYPAEAGAMTRVAGPAGVPSRDVGLAGATGGAGSAPSPRDVPSEPMVRLVDDTDPGVRSGSATERPVTGPQAVAPPITRAFPAPVPTFTPIGETRPAGFTAEPGPAEPRSSLDQPAGSPPDVMAAELAGWASGELPGQSSELASWTGTDAPGRALGRSRSAR
jgi:hypothetical protein